MSAMRTVDIGGLTVVEHPSLISGQAPRAVPGRPPILFVHGIMVGAWVFEGLQHFFADRGYTTWAVNLRGHNGSRPVPDVGRISIMDYVADVLEVAAWIAQRTGQAPILFGHSMGGLVAQKAAEASGTAPALVLLASAAPRGIRLADPPLMLKQLKYLPNLLLSKPLPPTRELDTLALNMVPEPVRDALRDRFVSGSARAGREMSTGAIRVDPAKVRCPLLSISCAHDRFIPPRVGRQLAQKYHAPYWLLPDHGHFFVAEPGWEEPMAAVDGWLEHALARAADPQRYAALWSDLRARIGDDVELRFYDGRAVKAEIVNVDLAEHQDLIFDVREVRAPGPRHLPPLVPGTTAVVPLGELAGFSRVD